MTEDNRQMLLLGFKMSRRMVASRAPHELNIEYHGINSVSHQRFIRIAGLIRQQYELDGTTDHYGLGSLIAVS